LNQQLRKKHPLKRKSLMLNLKKLKQYQLRSLRQRSPKLKK
jgi:hypothetical protein